MGQEARTTVRYRDCIEQGKAVLETDELIFRGDDGLRLRLPFKSMQSVKAQDGELRVDAPDGPAVFDLGPEAAKWAHKILHPKSLLDKLGVKPGMQVLVLGVADDAFLTDLRERTDGAGEPNDNYDMAFVAVNEPRDVDQLAELKRAIKPDGAVWAVFRKGRKDFNENDVLRGGLAAGLVDVKVVRFSETHTASKFVIRKAERR